MGAGGSRRPLNDTEQVKHDDALLNVRDRIEIAIPKGFRQRPIQPSAPPHIEREQWTSKRYRRKSLGECIAVRPGIDNGGRHGRGELADRLYDTAANYRAVTSKLVRGPQAPAAIAMTQAAAPYIGWLNATAAQAEHAATQAAAAASAHESALAAMVPPQAINANRAQLISLATTNYLGQTSPAIADIDAEYEQMWATDADAMYAYAGASADASTVTPFTSPPATTAGPVGQGAVTGRASGAWILRLAPEIILAGNQVIPTIPEALRALFSSPLTSFRTSLSSVTSPLSNLSSLSAPSGFAITHLNRLNKAAASCRSHRTRVV